MCTCAEALTFERNGLEGRTINVWSSVGKIKGNRATLTCITALRFAEAQLGASTLSTR